MNLKEGLSPLKKRTKIHSLIMLNSPMIWPKRGRGKAFSNASCSQLLVFSQLRTKLNSHLEGPHLAVKVLTMVTHSMVDHSNPGTQEAAPLVTTSPLLSTFLMFLRLLRTSI
jgi:hypothetical protein